MTAICRSSSWTRETPTWVSSVELGSLEKKWSSGRGKPCTGYPESAGSLFFQWIELSTRNSNKLRLTAPFGWVSGVHLCFRQMKVTKYCQLHPGMIIMRFRRSLKKVLSKHSQFPKNSFEYRKDTWNSTTVKHSTRGYAGHFSCRVQTVYLSTRGNSDSEFIASPFLPPLQKIIHIMLQYQFLRQVF